MDAQSFGFSDVRLRLISASLEFGAIWAQSGLPGKGRIGSNDAHEAVVLRIHGLSSRRQAGPSTKPVTKN